MKFPLLVFALVISATAPSFAQDSANTITIIQEDGTEQSIVIAPQQAPVSEPSVESESISSSTDLEDAPEVMDVEGVNEPEVETVTEVPEVETPAAETEVLTEEAPVEEIPAAEPEELAPETIGEEVIPAAESEEPEPVAEPIPDPAPAPKAAPKPAPKKAAQDIKVKPRKKPQYNPQEKTAVKNAAPISQNLALSLAIDEAPAVDDYQIFKNYQGDIPIYQVIFKTGDKFYEVQVDAFDGIILYSGYRYDLDDYSPKAGHLPRKLAP